MRTGKGPYGRPAGSFYGGQGIRPMQPRPQMRGTGMGGMGMSGGMTAGPAPSAPPAPPAPTAPPAPPILPRPEPMQSAQADPYAGMTGSEIFARLFAPRP